MRPFRFLAEARKIVSGRELAETARRAEATGIDVQFLGCGRNSESARS